MHGFTDYQQVHARRGHLFPCLPKQPGYHKRVKAAAPLIGKATMHLATLCPSWADDLRLPALAAAIWHNWHIGAGNMRSLIAYDH